MTIIYHATARADFCIIKYYKMEPNLSIKESIVRYAVMAGLVIFGGLLHNVWIMALGVPIFITGLTGTCPVYHMLGINHANH
jgi:hypothetical protein